jgi:hypothetical protein
MGGAGKTQLVLRYLEERRDRYSAIFWIDATDEFSTLRSFERIAREIHRSILPSEGHRWVISEHSYKGIEAVNFVLKRLQGSELGNGEWIVVFDNFNDLNWPFMQYIPSSGQGNVVITSQDKRTQMLCQSGLVEIAEMEPQEALPLFLNTAGIRDPSQSDKNAAQKVIEFLGCHALAVDLAGAYLSQRHLLRSNLEEYLVLLRRKGT